VNLLTSRQRDWAKAIKLTPDGTRNVGSPGAVLVPGRDHAARSLPSRPVRNGGGVVRRTALSEDDFDHGLVHNHVQAR
jgi:hypothetical protein